MRSATTCFEGMGKRFTEETLSITSARAADLGIKGIVLASTTRYTLEKALETFSGQDVRIASGRRATKAILCRLAGPLGGARPYCHL